MLGNAYTNQTRSTQLLLGKLIECELCEEVRRCTEHCQLTACLECQAEFLPRRKLL